MHDSIPLFLWGERKLEAFHQTQHLRCYICNRTDVWTGPLACLSLFSVSWLDKDWYLGTELVKSVLGPFHKVYSPSHLDWKSNTFGKRFSSSLNTSSTLKTSYLQAIKQYLNIFGIPTNCLIFYRDSKASMYSDSHCNWWDYLFPFFIFLYGLVVQQLNIGEKLFFVCV